MNKIPDSLDFFKDNPYVMAVKETLCTLGVKNYSFHTTYDDESHPLQDYSRRNKFGQNTTFVQYNTYKPVLAILPFYNAPPLLEHNPRNGEHYWATLQITSDENNIIFFFFDGDDGTLCEYNNESGNVYARVDGNLTKVYQLPEHTKTFYYEVDSQMNLYMGNNSNDKRLITNFGNYSKKFLTSSTKYSFIPQLACRTNNLKILNSGVITVPYIDIKFKNTNEITKSTYGSFLDDINYNLALSNKQEYNLQFYNDTPFSQNRFLIIFENRIDTSLDKIIIRFGKGNDSGYFKSIGGVETKLAPLFDNDVICQNKNFFRFNIKDNVILCYVGGKVEPDFIIDSSVFDFSNFYHFEYNFGGVGTFLLKN